MPRCKAPWSTHQSLLVSILSREMGRRDGDRLRPGGPEGDLLVRRQIGSGESYFFSTPNSRDLPHPPRLSALLTRFRTAPKEFCDGDPTPSGMADDVGG